MGALVSYYNLYNLAEHKLLMSSNVVLVFVWWCGEFFSQYNGFKVFEC